MFHDNNQNESGFQTNRPETVSVCVFLGYRHIWVIKIWKSDVSKISGCQGKNENKHLREKLWWKISNFGVITRGRVYTILILDIKLDVLKIFVYSQRLAVKFIKCYISSR